MKRRIRTASVQQYVIVRIDTANQVSAAQVSGDDQSFDTLEEAKQWIVENFTNHWCYYIAKIEVLATEQRTVNFVTDKSSI